MATSLSGFTLFIRNQMGIPDTVLPNTDPMIEQAYEVALAIVNPSFSAASTLIYDLMVYNLAGDNLINFAVDVPGSNYFYELRQTLALYVFVPGVVTSAGDGGTSGSIANTDAMKEFTLANLQNLKTPWGRQYLAYAQTYGGLWGLS